MTTFEAKSNECWVCGGKHNLTSHHAIPQVIHPKNNVTVTICEACHHKINQIDYGAVSSYLYKILKVLEEKTNAIKSLQKIVEAKKDAIQKP